MIGTGEEWSGTLEGQGVMAWIGLGYGYYDFLGMQQGWLRLRVCQ
jgi:hypothetical protein